MIAILKHELSSYFTSVSGYVFGAFLLLFAGIYTMVYNLNLGYTYFEYVLGSLPFIFLVAVPILTMRVLAEERRQKTDQLLYSLPLTMTEVVVGKYLAMLALFALPCLIIGLYPLLLSAYGSIYLPTVYATLLGFFLLGASLISVGMFISSTTESQAVAAGLCFVVLLMDYYCVSLASYLSSSAFASLLALAITALLIAAIVLLMTKSLLAALLAAVVMEGGLVGWYLTSSSSFEGLFATLMTQISLFTRIDNFVYGVFDYTAIVFFLSVIAVFLTLSVQSMEKRRWSE